MAVLLKNNSEVLKIWGGVEISSSGTYELQESDHKRLLMDDIFLLDLENGDAIINYENEDMDHECGLLILQRKLRYRHDEVVINNLSGILCPSTVEVTPCVIALEFEETERIYFQTRFDNIVNIDIKLELHLCINNSESDKWIQYKLDFLTTNGVDDGKLMDTLSSTVTFDACLVPTNLYEVFAIECSIPTSYFANGEKYLFGRLTRITATGKDAPTNNPLLLRICKIYYEKVIM